jgi:hypothetical protein
VGKQFGGSREDRKLTGRSVHGSAHRREVVLGHASHRGVRCPGHRGTQPRCPGRGDCDGVREGQSSGIRDGKDEGSKVDLAISSCSGRG